MVKNIVQVLIVNFFFKNFCLIVYLCLDLFKRKLNKNDKINSKILQKT